MAGEGSQALSAGEHTGINKSSSMQWSGHYYESIPLENQTYFRWDDLNYFVPAKQEEIQRLKEMEKR